MIEEAAAGLKTLSQTCSIYFMEDGLELYDSPASIRKGFSCAISSTILIPANLSAPQGKFESVSPYVIDDRLLTLIRVIYHAVFSIFIGMYIHVRIGAEPPEQLTLAMSAPHHCTQKQSGVFQRIR